MWTLLSRLRSQPGFRKKLLTAALVLALGGAAFYLGRLVGVQRIEAQTPGGPSSLDPVAAKGAQSPADSEYGRRIVATIYGNIPITREELGEFLITRFGADRLEFLVNRKIVEKACQAYGITVTDAEIAAQLRVDLGKYGGPTMTEKMFADQILRKFNKSLLEWKEDVIRPKLMLTNYCKSKKVEVPEDDIRKVFESRYGPKVLCRLIVLEQHNKFKDDIWLAVKDNEAKFKEYARKQPISELAAKEGEAPPIYRHFGDAWIEQQAFSMKPGDVSPLRQMEDKTWLIMRCEKHLPADTTVTYQSERLKLAQELEEVTLAKNVADTFKRLRDQAAPHLYLTAQQRQNDLDVQLRQEVTPASGPVSTAAPSLPK